MKFAIIGGGQLGQQLFNASSCQRMIIDTRPQCPEYFAKAELGYSNDLKDAAKCDVVALAVPPAACQSVMDAICPVLPAGTIVLDFPTKWQIPQEMRAAYPQLKLMESKLLGSAVGLSKGLEALVLLSQADEETVQKVKDCLPGLNVAVGQWDKVPYLNSEASRAALVAAVELEKKLLGEGYEEEVVKSLIGGLMPGILVSYRNDTLGGFGKEIVKSLK